MIFIHWITWLSWLKKTLLFDESNALGSVAKRNSLSEVEHQNPAGKIGENVVWDSYLREHHWLAAMRWTVHMLVTIDSLDSLLLGSLLWRAVVTAFQLPKPVMNGPLLSFLSFLEAILFCTELDLLLFISPSRSIVYYLLFTLLSQSTKSSSVWSTNLR